MKRIWVWLGIVLLFCGGRALGASSALLLEQGVYAEESLGDLDQAIEHYASVVADQQASRSQMAEALLRLGRCNEVRGDQGAALAHLQRLVQQFPEQEPFAVEAKAMVARLGVVSSFLELKNNWLVYKLNLGPMGEGAPLQEPEFSVNQVDALGLIWSVDASLSNRIDRFEVRMLPPEGSQGAPMVLRQDHPGTKRYCRIHSLMTATPGHYRLRVEGFAKGGERPIAVAGAFLKIGEPRYVHIQQLDIQSSREVDFSLVECRLNLGDDEMSRSTFSCAEQFHVSSLENMFTNQPLNWSESCTNGVRTHSVIYEEPVKSFNPYGVIRRGHASGLIEKVAGTKDEFRYVFNHAPESALPLRRVELLQLPEGAELLSTTPPGLKHRTRKGRIQVMVDQLMPPLGEVQTEVHYRFNEPETLPLQPVPWKAGEYMRYRFVASSGKELGHQIFMVEEGEQDGEPCWFIEQRMVAPSIGTVVGAQAIVRKDDFTPIKGWMKNALGFAAITYGDGWIARRTGGSKTYVTNKVDKLYYDNEQALHLMRRLPLQKGFSVDFPIISATAGQCFMQCAIVVEDRETLQVPMGEFPCWKVRLEVRIGPLKVVEQFFWITEKERWVAKLDASNFRMELEQVGNLNEPSLPLVLPEHEVRLPLPKGWFAAPWDAPRDEQIAQFLSPYMNVRTALYKKRLASPDMTLRAMVDEDIEVLKEDWKDFCIMDDSIVERENAGVPTVSFLGGTKGGVSRELRTYYRFDDRVYWFTFNLFERFFEENREAIDALVNEIRFVKQDV